MNNSKITRLLLGLIILFSFFIFQSSDDTSGCSDCSGESDQGTLILQNELFSGLPIRYAITPSGKSGTLSHGYQKSISLDAGTYTVVAKDAGFSQAIVGSRSFEITANISVTIKFE